MNGPENVQEFIIIKRGHYEEEGHHGGAWKIAFADFMTAMMALFLVLWLINAANEETKRAVASYFNPVKLVERNRSVKGMEDSDGSTDVEKKAPNQKFPEDSGGPAEGEKTSMTDAKFFSKPFAVLNDIAMNEAQGQLNNVAEDGGRNGDAQIDSASGGTEFSDPFSPNFWVQEVQSNKKGPDQGVVNNTGEASGSEPPPASDKAGETDTRNIEVAGVVSNGEDGAGTADSKSGENAEPAAGASGQTSVPGESQQTGAGPSDGMASEQTGENLASIEGQAETQSGKSAAEKAAGKIREQIQTKLAKAFGQDSQLPREVSVVARDNGIMVSLTDSLDISMFGVGSAVPSHDLVIALEKIGEVLSEQNGKIRIRGHTDARPFSSGDYDNWRLSSARAQSAYYMLVRGGLDETRIQEISGLADRELLYPEQPLSPRNRRIEVLVDLGMQ